MYFSLTSLDFLTGPSLGCLSPSWSHQLSSGMQASLVQSKGKWHEKKNITLLQCGEHFSLRKKIKQETITVTTEVKCNNAINLSDKIVLGYEQLQIKHYGPTNNLFSISCPKFS